MKGRVSVFIAIAFTLGFIIKKMNNTKKLSTEQREKLKAYLKSKHGLDFKDWTIVAIRGARLNSQNNIEAIPNIRNQFNDLMLLIKEDETKVWNGNVDPGTPGIKNPINKHGTFVLLPGLYTVQRWRHGRTIWKDGKRVRASEKAFNILDPKGQRDKNQDGIYDEKDPTVTLTQWAGVNIHPINRKNPKTVDRASYGCLNLQSYWEDPSWIEFRDTLFNDSNKTWKLSFIESKEIV